MRVIIGGIQQESNTFSPRPTTLADFEAGYLLNGVELERQLRDRRFEYAGAYQAADEEEIKVVPSLACWATPSGPLTAETYALLKERLLSAIRAVGPADGVLTVLHGAMVVEGIDDPEGDLLAAVRLLVGPATPIVVSLDLHANLTRQMVVNSDALVGYHTVPHVDHYETGQRAMRLLAKLVRQTVRPAMAYRKLPMITPAERHDTNRAPMRQLIEEVLALEAQPGVLAAGLYPVQPWLDIGELGWAVLVVMNNDPVGAQERVDRLAEQAWALRREFLVEKLSIPAAIDRALRVRGQPVVLADTGDITSGGAPGDSAALLEGLLAAGSPCTALLDIVDPEATARASAAGVGSTLTLMLGGKIDRLRQRPVEVTARVRALSDGLFTIEGPSLRGYRANLGRTAVLEIGPISVVVHERGEMNVDPALYRSVGLEPLRAKIVQVKSPCGFRAAYEPIAAEILLLDSPGCTTTRFAELPFQRVPRPLFPLDELPDDLTEATTRQR